MIRGIKQSLVAAETLQKTKQYNGPFSMDCRERRFHARGVYPTQDTSLMRTARVKQEEDADTRIIVIE